MKKFILYTVSLCLFIFVLKANPFSYLKPNEVESPEPFSLISPTMKGAVETAHAYSVNHRMLAGYCAGDINPNQQGYLEMTMENIQDLLATAKKIQTGTTQKPTKFRMIFGNLSDASTESGSIMMVVGLNSSGSDILSGDNGNPLIYRLSNPIPCPRHCDVTKSDIIYYGGRECNQ